MVWFEAMTWYFAHSCESERFIGSLRRECLDHIIVFNEASLRRIVKTYFDYYERPRTLLALEKVTLTTEFKDCDYSRFVETNIVEN